MQIVRKFFPKMLIHLNVLVASVYAFGRIGHSLTGSIAQQLLSPAAKTMVSTLLPEFHGDLSRAATWADEIKSDRSYDWSKPLHYVNPANDNPPDTCSYLGEIDCPHGICVVNAIRNYTALLGLKSSNQNVALKFLIHFIGDLHQPLHASNYC